MNSFFHAVRAWRGPALLRTSKLLVATAVLGGLFGCSLVSCQNSNSVEVSPPAEAPKGVPFFQDMTELCGIDFKYKNAEIEPHYPRQLLKDGKSPHYAILESLGGGGGLIDYDGDGLLDIFIAGGGYYDGPELKQIKGHPNRLYKNLGGWNFQDVTKEVGLDRLADSQPLFFSHGCAVCDYDKDSWPDLLVTGYGRVALYRNVPNGKARMFKDVTKEAGLLEGGHFWSTSAGFADFDGDGWPDLYVCQYVNWSFDNNPFCPGYSPGIRQDVCPPKTFQSRPHALYRNDGTGHFIDVTKSAGIRVDRRAEVAGLEKKLEPKRKTVEKRTETELKLKDSNTAPEQKKHLERELNRLVRELEVLERQLEPVERDLERAKNDDFGKGLGVIIVDVNGDGKPDIYVANDTSDNFLYLNRSTPGVIKFDDVGGEMGVDKDAYGAAQGSMGVDAGDPFGSGWPCLWTTNYEGELHALYRNRRRDDGQHFFAFATSSAGLAAIGQTYVGFGTGFLDLDNDGWEDIFISNGHVIRNPVPHPLAQRPVLFYNQGQGKFKDITPHEGPYFQTGHRGRGVAIGDLDNDGLADLVIFPVREQTSFLRNAGPVKNHWLGIRLASKDNQTVVGSRLILEVDGRKLTRFAKGGGSYLSANDQRHLFGLGTAVKSGKLTVEWASGQPRQESWQNLKIDEYHKLVQGTGQRQ